MTDLCLDLDKLGVDKRIFAVALGMVLDEDLKGFGVAVLGEKPTG